MVYSAKHREYQLVTKSTVPCFFTGVIFTISIFPLWYAPAVPPELGAQRKFGGTLKNFRRFVCAPNFKTVSAPMHGGCRLQHITYLHGHWVKWIRNGNVFRRSNEKTTADIL